MFADDTTIPLPAMYIDTLDPAVTYTDGRVKAGRLWLDSSTGTIGTLKKRNAGNTGWDTLINLDAAAATLTTEQVQDIVGAMFADTATIDWTYDDATGVVNGVVIGAAPSGSAGGDLSGTYPNPTVQTSVIDARIKLLQKWTLNFTANGDAYIPAYEAMTIDIGTAAIGTGTLAYEKSTTASPGTFSSTSLPATLQAGAWLKVSVTGLSGFKAVELKRTA